MRPKARPALPSAGAWAGGLGLGPGPRAWAEGGSVNIPVNTYACADGLVTIPINNNVMSWLLRA